MTQINTGLFVNNDPGDTGVQPLRYLKSQVLQLAELLAASTRFGVVLVDGITIHAKSPEHRTVLMVRFTSERFRNRLGQGRFVYLSGEASLFEVDIEENGGREQLLATLYAESASLFGSLVLGNSQAGRSTVFLQHRGAPAFDGSDQPVVGERYLNSTLAYLELLYGAVKGCDKELGTSLVNPVPIQPPLDAWIRSLKTGTLQTTHSSDPIENRAEGL